MTRRSGLALLSATALTAGALALVLAPAASADVPTVLGPVSVSDTSVEVGDSIQVSGTNCVSLPTPGAGSASAASADASAAAATPAAAVEGGKVRVTVDGPNSFFTAANADANSAGEWSVGSITLGSDPGTYTVSAGCTLVDAAGTQIVVAYDSVDVEATAAPVVYDPSVICSTCSVTAGDPAVVAGVGFDPAGGSVTFALAGASATVAQTGGATESVSLVVPASQPSGTLTGTATQGTLSATFSVTVTGVDVDGPVPTATASTTTSATSTAGSGSDDDEDDDTSYTSTGSGLATTGSDALWTGVVGGMLLVAGGALTWVARRRRGAHSAV